MARPSTIVRSWKRVSIGLAFVAVVTTLLLLAFSQFSNVGPYFGGPPDADPDIAPPTAFPPGVPGTLEGALRPWAEECRRTLGETDFDGEVIYPQTLPADLEHTVTYQAVIDLGESDLPPEQVITNPDGTTVAREIRVQCVVGARLQPVGDDITVEEDPESAGAGWVNRKFGGTGTIDWAWAVRPTAPKDQQVRLQLRPTLSINDGSQTIASDSVTTYVTTVQVDGTLIQELSYWFETEWKRLTAVAFTLGAAVLAVLTWFRKVRQTAHSEGVPPPSPTT